MPSLPLFDGATHTGRQRRAWRGGWLPLAVLVAAVSVLLDLSGMLVRPNRLLQDALIRLQTQNVSQGDVVIVAIDDTSIAALGQWPWSRTLYASAIDTISGAQPRAIGLDVLLLEPSGDARADAALAASLRRSGKVALPMIMQNIDGRATATLPLPAFAQAAALGQAHLDVDSDGVARAVYLREGQGERRWPHLALAMLGIARGEAPTLAPTAIAAPAAHLDAARDAVRSQALPWYRDDRNLIAFAGPPGHFPTVSYVDVLEGQVPPDVFRNRYVLIGAMAAGLGDRYATPMSAQPELMAGVEVTANVLHGLLEQRAITPLPPWANGLLNALSVVAMLALACVGPLAALLAALLGLVLLPAISALAFVAGHVLFAPAAGMAGIALAYALWSWQRLNVATRYLVDEFQTLRNSTGIGRWAGAQPAIRGDFLARRIDALDQATQHLRDLYQLLSDSLDSLPDATLACDLAGHVLLANPSAARLLGQSAQALTGQSLALLLADLRRSGDGRPALPAGRLAQTQETVAIEANDAQGHALLLKLAPSRNASGQHTGWLVSLVDISEIRRAQRQRAEAIRFLGHDIRAPQSSILSLLELRRSAPGHIPMDQFEARIERHARKTLKLSDDFIQLLRAQTGDHRLAPHNLASIVDECLDDAWETAARRQIALRLSSTNRPDAMVRADREMLARAVDNLIGNALKFSPPGSHVICGVSPTMQEGRAAWRIEVTDQGPGVMPQDRDRLFTPFTRGSQATQADGAGLGLAFVKAVADSHGGWIALQSTPGQGASFFIILPAIGEGDADTVQP